MHLRRFAPIAFVVLAIGCAKAVTDISIDGGTGTDASIPTGDAAVDVAIGGACKTNVDCKDPKTPKCDPTAKLCVACLPTADDCASGTYCAKVGQGYACQTGCKADPECATALDGGVSDAAADGDAGFVPQTTPACCDHVCVNTSIDAKNCGKCGSACTAGSSCCNSTCLDTQTTLANCGGCGKTCAPQNVTTAQCTAGSCGYSTCTGGFSDCDNDKSTGCEADTQTDKNNCGVCGKKCVGSETCVAGTCVVCGTNEVSFNGKCYYLDGSGGTCIQGYARAPQTALAQVASMFAGKNYKSKVSTNCCVWTSDNVQNYGMTTHCNANGPFSNGEPALGGTGCSGVYITGAGQLTFCGN